MGSLIDLSGHRYGRLSVIERDQTAAIGSPVRWICVCDCGNRHVARGGLLRYGSVRSCGCLLSDVCAEKGRRKRTHGMTGSPTYNTWVSMRGRCENSSDPKFPIYGGRGISVCDRWNDFASFLADMGERPSSKHSIDRIDVNGNYCPENCRWATQIQQQNNRRDNVLLTVDGITDTLSQAARRYAIDAGLVSLRISRGWTVERALKTPPISKHRSKNFRAAAHTRATVRAMGLWPADLPAWPDDQEEAA